MIGSRGHRAARRKNGRARKMALAGAAAAAMTVGLATAPAAQAIDIVVDRDYTWDPVYSSGFVAGLLDFVSKIAPGVNAQLSDTISFQTGPPPSLGLSVQTALSVNAFVTTINADVTVALNLNLRKIADDAKNLYNTEAGIPQPGCNQAYGINIQGPKGYASTCRYVVQLATIGAVQNLIDAYLAQIASVQGDTPSGLIPFTYGPNATATFTGNVNGANGPAYTNQGLLFLQNHLRPNGGMAARFPAITRLLGIDPNMPGAGKTVSPDGKIVLNTTTLDLTWAYDPIGDFPAVLNLFALANSWAAGLPLNIVTGGLASEPLQGSSLGDIGVNLAGLLQLPINASVKILGIEGVLNTLAMEDGKAFYSTLVPNELPITAAIGLTPTLLNFGLQALGANFRFGNPIGDALAPAMRILVNTGYTDVLSPDELNYCATGCGTPDAKTWAQLGYQAYDRTFGAYAAPGSVMSASTLVPFNSVATLNPQERAQATRDAWQALLEGIRAQLAKPLWGIVEPVSSTSTAASTASRAVASRVAETAPVEVPAAPEAPAADTAVDPAPSVLSAASAQAPKQGSVRASRGKAESRPDVSAARQPAAASVAADDDAVKPAAASGGKQRVTR